MTIIRVRPLFSELYPWDPFANDGVDRGWTAELLAASRARLGASPESAAGTSAVRIRLPSGKMLQRKFPPLAPLSLVVDYVVVASRELSGEEALDPLAFDLVVNQPKRTFNLHTQGSTDFELSLQSAGVVGAVVLVHKCSR